MPETTNNKYEPIDVSPENLRRPFKRAWWKSLDALIITSIIVLLSTGYTYIIGFVFYFPEIYFLKLPILVSIAKFLFLPFNLIPDGFLVDSSGFVPAINLPGFIFVQIICVLWVYFCAILFFQLFSKITNRKLISYSLFFLILFAYSYVFSNYTQSKCVVAMKNAGNIEKSGLIIIDFSNTVSNREYQEIWQSTVPFPQERIDSIASRFNLLSIINLPAKVNTVYAKVQSGKELETVCALKNTYVSEHIAHVPTEKQILEFEGSRYSRDFRAEIFWKNVDKNFCTAHKFRSFSEKHCQKVLNNGRLEGSLPDF